MLTYGRSVGLELDRRTVLVEGTSDADVFLLAARLELEKTGTNLLSDGMAICPAGIGDLGGTRGVLRELMVLRGLARVSLLPNGRPRYRFIALFDNDKAGRQAVKAARDLDGSILEYKDVFRLWPVMPMPAALDPVSMQRAFGAENDRYKGMEWELEDLLPGSFAEAFVSEHPESVAKSTAIEGKTHREYTRDGKAKLLRFLKINALRDDLQNVIDVLRAFRFYFGLPRL